MAVDITDAGRVALGGSMGPEIAQIEGRLVERNPSEMTVAVSSVHLLRGGDQVWHGENVHIRSEYVSTMYERHFSTAKSLAMGAAGVGAIAFIATRSLLGNSTTTRTPTGPDTSGHTQRRPARP